MKPILLSFYFPRSIEVEGAAAMFDSLGSVLASQGFEVTLHAPLEDKPDAPYRISNYHGRGRLSHSRYLADLRERARSYPSVFVALSSPASFAWTRKALRDHPRPVYYFGSPLQEWGEIFKAPFSFQYSKHWVAKNSLLMKLGKPDRETCVVGTRYQREQLLERGIPEGAVRLLPLSISKRSVRSFEKPELRKEFSLPEGPLIGYLGHFSPIKGVPVLVRAFERALAKNPDLHLAIAWSGKGEESRRVREMLESPNLKGRVHLTGVVDSYRYLAAMDLVCLPFVHSSFPHLPLVLLESFAVGTPVVTSDIAGLPEAVRNGETGWLVPSNDPESLAATLLEAFGRPARLGEMGKNAQRFVREEECIEAHLDTLLEIL